MLPLVLPSDPRLLSAVPGNAVTGKKEKRESALLTPNGNGSFPEERSVSRASAVSRGAMAWRSRGRKLRVIGIETLEWVDGVRGLGRWSGGADPGTFGGEEESDEMDTATRAEDEELTDKRPLEKPYRNGDARWLSEVGTTLTQKPRKASGHGLRKGRESSIGGDTAMPEPDE